MKRAQPLTDLAIIVFLVACTGAVFWRAASFGFVMFDDSAYVWNNPIVMRGLTWQGVKWAFTTFDQANWHPLTYLSLMVDTAIGGGRPSVLHLTNIVLHLCNTALLFLVLNALTSRKWPSAFVAALFGVHPLHVESVVWISERKDVLSTLFWLLTMWGYTSWTRTRKPRTYLLTLLAFASGLMSKPMLVSLPIVLLLLDYWPVARIDTQHPAPNTQHLRSLVFEKIPFLMLSAASCVVTVWAQSSQKVVFSLGTVPLGIRASNAVVSYVVYLRKLFWPSDLSMFYPHPGATLPVWTVAASTGFLVAVTALALCFRRRAPYLLVGWMWYVITLVPVIGIVQVGAQAMADRYTYVPLIGFLIIIAWGASAVTGKLMAGRAAALVLALSALIAICLAAGAGRKQVGYWKDNVTLFRRAVEVDPTNDLAHTNLGCALADQGKWDEAAEHFRAAYEIDPDSPGASANIARCALFEGRIDDAAFYFRAELARDPGYESARQGLEQIRIVKTRLREAAQANNLAWQYATDPDPARRNPREAVRLGERARQLAGDGFETLDTLAAAYASAGRFADAARTAREAVRAARESGDMAAERRIAHRLKLYESGRAYADR